MESSKLKKRVVYLRIVGAAVAIVSLLAGIFLFLLGAVILVLSADEDVDDAGNRVRDLPVVQVVPGLWEGEGAITLGCSLYDTPQLMPYGKENEDTDTVGLQLRGDRDNPYQMLFVVDGPQGTVFLSGSYCGLSIDWRRFPASREGH